LLTLLALLGEAREAARAEGHGRVPNENDVEQIQVSLPRRGVVKTARAVHAPDASGRGDDDRRPSQNGRHEWRGDVDAMRGVTLGWEARVGEQWQELGGTN